jgi:glycosyltransferase involved in cell wall biosynthesis
MKIIHFIFSFKTGGAETMLIDIINEQIKTEQVSLIILNNQVNLTLVSTIDIRVKVYFISRPERSRNPWYIIKLNYIIWKLKPDVVHCHSYNAKRFLFTKVNSVYTAHTTGIPINNLAGYQKVFAISQSVNEDLLNRGALFNIIVVHNGVNCGLIESKDNYSLNPFRIIQIGRLDHLLKGQHIVLKALQFLIYNAGIRDIHIDFIGEGNGLEYLKQLSIEYKIESHTNFLGLKDRKYIYSRLKDYHLLTQPSLIEGFGLTIAEAMAAKVPVLVSDIDGPMETIENGKFGNFFKSQDPDDCAKKILEIMSNYNQIKGQTELAFNHCVQNFSIQSTSQKYLMSYL